MIIGPASLALHVARAEVRMARGNARARLRRSSRICGLFTWRTVEQMLGSFSAIRHLFQQDREKISAGTL